MAKTALIIGGTKGLGLSLSWEGFQRGVQPIITGRSIFYGEIRKSFPPNANLFVLDLCRYETIDRTIGHMARYYKDPVDYVFWVAGNFSRQPLTAMSQEEIQSMIATHLSGSVSALRSLHLWLGQKFKRPYHLVTIASTSSWRIRENETLYCALKAAKAAFTRNFARELVRDLPGSKVTLINPGGMKTSLFDGTGQDTSKFMETDAVANIIWNEVERQEKPFEEVQIMRNDDGSPNVSYGPQIPELPF